MDNKEQLISDDCHSVGEHNHKQLIENLNKSESDDFPPLETLQIYNKNNSTRPISPIRKIESACGGLSNIGEEQNEWLDMLGKDGINEAIADNDHSNSNSREKDDHTSSCEFCGYSVSKFDRTSCKTHGQAFIGVDTKAFRLVCKKCIQNGQTGYDLELLSLMEEEGCITFSNEEAVEEYACINHQEMQGDFYCDDCKAFICKKCFEDHKDHYVNFHRYISNMFKDFLQQAINDLQNALSPIETNQNELKSISKNIKEMKDKACKSLHSSIKNISEVNKSQVGLFKEKFIRKFDGLDGEVEMVLLRLTGLLNCINQLQSEIDELSHVVNTMSYNEKVLTNGEVCEFKQGKVSLLKTIEEMLDDFAHFQKVKLGNTLQEANENYQKYITHVATQRKCLSCYEKSTIFSISTGQSHNSFFLGRFKRFLHNEVKYFKTTSLLISANHEIYLTGLGVCGLYISSRRLSNPNYQLINLENRGGIPILITVSEFHSAHGQLADTKFSEHKHLYGIVQRGDPSFYMNFAKGVRLKANVKYVITVENESNMMYCDIWCGNVNRDSIKAMSQTITCNNTHISFTFIEAKGIQTDFDEFAIGLIEGILFFPAK